MFVMQTIKQLYSIKIYASSVCQQNNLPTCSGGGYTVLLISPFPVNTGVAAAAAAAALSPCTETCCCMADGVVAWFAVALLDASTENANEW